MDANEARAISAKAAIKERIERLIVEQANLGLYSLDLSKYEDIYAHFTKKEAGYFQEKGFKVVDNIISW